MLNAKDLELLSAKGISEEKINEQLACFEKGFPYLEIAASASVEKGIKVIPADAQAAYMDEWDAYLTKDKRILKFFLCFQIRRSGKKHLLKHLRIYRLNSHDKILLNLSLSHLQRRC